MIQTTPCPLIFRIRVVAAWMLLSISALFALPTAAQPACTSSNVVRGDWSSTIRLPGGAPNGTRLDAIPQSSYNIIRCTGGSTARERIEVLMEFAPGQTPIRNPYGPGYLIENTGIPGVGIVFEIPGDLLVGQVVHSFTLNPIGQTIQSDVPGMAVEVYRVKHGTFDSSRDWRMDAQSFLHAVWRQVGGPSSLLLNYMTTPAAHPSNDNLITETCRFAEPNKIFTFAPVAASSFIGQGLPPTSPQIFSTNMTIQCKAFYGGFVEITADADVRYPGVIKNSSDSGRATGVGVRLVGLDGQTPWDFNERHPIPPNPEMTNDGTWYGKNLWVNARLFQTEPQVTAGTFESVITLTFIYQ